MNRNRFDRQKKNKKSETQASKSSTAKRTGKRDEIEVIDLNTTDPDLDMYPGLEQNLWDEVDPEQSRDRVQNPRGHKKARQKKKAREVFDQIGQKAIDAASPEPSTTRSSGRKRNRPFGVVTYVFLALFIVLIAYFAYFQVFKSESVISSSYNPRLDLYAEHVIRGDIVSSDGKVLATTEVDSDGEETRVYPYANMFAHAVGYMSNGKAGIESQYNFYMLRSHSFFLTQLVNSLKDDKNQGDTIVSTLDYDIQEAAYNALGSDDGAVIVIEADTGKIKAMVSKPDYDPNTIASQWDSLTSDDSDSSVLLNRATQGQYPPGSTFKIITTLAYVHEHSQDYYEFSFKCSGEYTASGETIHCYGNTSHGKESLEEAFAYSCNSAYSSLGLDLDIKSFKKLAKQMLFNTELPTSLQSTAESTFSLTTDSSDGLIMQTSIGQGDTLVSPLHMAMIAAAIANDGVVMEPYIVESVESDSGYTVKTYDSVEYGSIMDEEDAELLQEYMSAVTSYGTAKALSGNGYEVAGKTGSAEYNSAGDSHGWFVGYASSGGKTYAIAVIVEDGGSGSSSAVPVAKKVFQACFN